MITKKEHIIKCLLEQENLLIYHQSVYWELGEKIFQLALCSIIMKFHNVSPSFFYKSYDQLTYQVTKIGVEQTKYLIKSGKIKWFFGDSQYNVDELINYGAKKKQSTVIAPFNSLNNFIKIKKINRSKIIGLENSGTTPNEIIDIYKKYKVSQMLKMSSSLKFCVLAAGEADIYAANARAYEWDIAAGHAILEHAGGYITTHDEKKFLYGKENYKNLPIIAKRSKKL